MNWFRKYHIEELRIMLKLRTDCNFHILHIGVNHPVKVSLRLCSFQMDVETIMLGLLNNTVEDTDLTFKKV